MLDRIPPEALPPLPAAAEPQSTLQLYPEKQSFSANRAAEPPEGDSPVTDVSPVTGVSVVSPETVKQ